MYSIYYDHYYYYYTRSEKKKEKYFGKDYCSCLPTDLRRDCFKRRRPGTLVNLKNYADLEKDHMETFLRFFLKLCSTPYFCFNKLL